MAFRKPGNMLPRIMGGKEKYTDTNEFLSPGVLVAYKKGVNYPSAASKVAVNNAAIQARNIVRIANDWMAKVVIQRRAEPAFFTAAMDRHFNLKSNGDLGNGLLTANVVDKSFSLRDAFKHDRRWVLNEIRENMLSLSFHLNTGMYLIDSDIQRRDILVGGKANALQTLGAGNEAYVAQHAKGKTFHLCGFRNGEVHIEFDLFPNYSLNSGARIIIHEAVHKYLNIPDTFYAWSPNYPPTLEKCMFDNADSYAWTAISLATQGLKHDGNSNVDWDACPGAKM